MKKFLAVVGLVVAALVAGVGVQAAGGQNWVQPAGDTRSPAKFQADCAAGIAADSCMGAPKPPGCPAGKHWSVQGSGIAHCVGDDYVCTGGTELTHDAMGNPYCVAPVVTRETTSRTCPAPQTGDIYSERYKTVHADGSVTYSNWSDYGQTCQNPPPPVCANGATNYPLCNSFPNTCTSSETLVSSTPCAAGEVGGPIQTFATVSCPGSVAGSKTTGTCTPGVCANGATNYPLCTYLPQPCPDRVAYCDAEALDSNTTRFTIGYYDYPAPSCQWQRNDVASCEYDSSRSSDNCSCDWLSQHYDVE